MQNKNSKKKDSKKIAVFGKKLNFASREAYNLLRTNLTFSFSGEKSGRVVGVTSASPHEGKSTTSINLAYSLADAGNKVLLVDADMRRPSVASSLELELEPGLSDALAGNCEAKIHTGVLQENLSVLTAGHIPPNPSELLSSDAMETVIEKYKKQYDYVVVDLPPILVVTDAAVASKHFSGLILVIRHASTKRREIADAIRQLDYVGAKILGFVYTKMDIGRKKNYKYYKKY